MTDRIRKRSVPPVRALVGALATLLVVFALAGAAMADDGDISGCCICECGDSLATTSGFATAIPANAVCVDVSGPSACSSECDGACTSGICISHPFEPLACSQIAGCAQANTQTMAPAASPWILAALGLVLASLGLSAVRRRSDGAG